MTTESIIHKLSGTCFTGGLKPRSCKRFNPGGIIPASWQRCSQMKNVAFCHEKIEYEDKTAFHPGPALPPSGDAF